MHRLFQYVIVLTLHVPATPEAQKTEEIKLALHLVKSRPGLESIEIAREVDENKVVGVLRAGGRTAQTHPGGLNHGI